MFHFYLHRQTEPNPLTQADYSQFTETDYSQFNVLVFDSGVGGLSIAEQIQTSLPSLQLTYVGDTGFFPYGLKDEQTLSDRITFLLSRLCKKLHPDLIVIACNTASTLVLDRLRAELNIPIVGVVPAIKPAAQVSKTKTIGLLATQATVSRQYTHDLVEQYAKDCQVIYIGSPRLVEIAELKLNGQKLDSDTIQELRQVMQPFLNDKMAGKLDTIVLGCTHFPLIKAELQACIPEFTGNWVDSGKAIANRVAFLLDNTINPTKKPKTPHKHKAYWSQSGLFTAGFEQALAERGFQCLALASIIDLNG